MLVLLFVASVSAAFSPTAAPPGPDCENPNRYYCGDSVWYQTPTPRPSSLNLVDGVAPPARSLYICDPQNQFKMKLFMECPFGCSKSADFQNSDFCSSGWDHADQCLRGSLLANGLILSPQAQSGPQLQLTAGAIDCSAFTTSPQRSYVFTSKQNGNCDAFTLPPRTFGNFESAITNCWGTKWSGSRSCTVLQDPGPYGEDTWSLAEIGTNVRPSLLDQTKVVLRTIASTVFSEVLIPNSCTSSPPPTGQLATKYVRYNTSYTQSVNFIRYSVLPLVGPGGKLLPAFTYAVSSQLDINLVPPSSSGSGFCDQAAKIAGILSLAGGVTAVAAPVSASLFLAGSIVTTVCAFV